MNSFARIASLVTAIVIAAGAFEPFYLRVFALDRARFGAAMTDLQYRKVPHLREFLEGVRLQTRQGESVALATPFRTWDGGYEYCYGRSMYLLAGREVLPLIDPGNRVRPDNLSRAAAVAAFGRVPEIPGFRVAWRSPYGALLRRAN